MLALDAELAAICFALVCAMQAPKCLHIALFTDSIAAACRALDLSIHSGQGHSLAVYRALSEWLLADAEHTLTFVDVPSALSGTYTILLTNWFASSLQCQEIS